MSTRAKVITAVMVVILTICAIFLLLLSRQHQHYLEKSIATQLESADTVAETIIQQVSSNYALRIHGFVNYKASRSKEALVRAFAQRDRRLLQELSRPFFDILKNENPYFSTLGWILPDNTAFLRVHAPDNFGQNVGTIRPDVAAVNKEKRQQAGFTTGYVGLQYRVVHPVFFNDSYIGATQFGIKGTVLLDTLSNQLGTAVCLTMPLSEYNTILPEYRKELMRGPSHAVRVSHPDLFEPLLDEIDWRQERQTFTLKGHTYALCRVSALTNCQGDELAHLFVALDITNELQQGRSFLLTAFWLSALLSTISFIILYVSYGALVEKIVALNLSLARTNRRLEEKVRERTEKLFTEMEGKKKTEARLQKAEKMEAIGLMAGGVAHDLNNILSGVVNYPELLLMKLPEENELRAPITAIHESGLRAAAVVDDLLTVARSAAKVREIADINIIIHEYLASLEGQKLLTRYPDVHIKTRLAPDLCNISCSPVHIRKCLMNLVINAAEALQDSGTIVISTENRSFSGAEAQVDIKAGNYVALVVTDNGPGIAAEDLDHIFEPFYTKKKMGRSGSGIGLAVVRNAVQDHNGSIRVQSSSGNGTSFTLLFPATTLQQASLDDIQVNMASLQGNGEKILVVDDEPHQREIASQALTLLGYTVTALSSGEKAVRYMASHEADLILLDMLMEPGINGRRTYEEILKNHPGQKAVIASGFSESDEVKKAARLGAGGFIKKPYTLEELAVAVKNELRKGS